MGRKAIDMTSQVFGSWTVLGRSEQPGQTKSALWDCRCVCGAVARVQRANLVHGRSRQCEACRNAKLTTHGLCGSPEYMTWLGVKQRTGNPNSPSWPHYGGRGITMAPVWRDSFETFLADMGARPSPRHSIERMDNEGPYGPGNCRWATRKEQSLNTRRNVRWAYDGHTKTISEWGRDLGIDPNTLRERVVKCGWSVGKALSTPVQKG
jgi:hypothetical protein